jgi:hypothetical protein
LFSWADAYHVDKTTQTLYSLDITSTCKRGIANAVPCANKISDTTSTGMAL